MRKVAGWVLLVWGLMVAVNNVVANATAAQGPEPRPGLGTPTGFDLLALGMVVVGGFLLLGGGRSSRTGTGRERPPSRFRKCGNGE